MIFEIIKTSNNAIFQISKNNFINPDECITFLRRYDAFHDTSSDPHKQKSLDKNGKHKGNSDTDLFYERSKHVCR